MQIIIPMSGEGIRFRTAGYNVVKPLIMVHGKPILEYIISMFPGDHSFIFICLKEHAIQYNLEAYIPSICSNAKIIAIEKHKFGPVYATLQATDEIMDDEPVLLSYCDYFMKWDFDDFIKEINKSEDDGNVICYTGFHPHLLPEQNVYASCRVNNKMELIEIKEKFSFEADKSKGFHSAGAYYFKSGRLMKKYFIEAIQANLSLNGEFFASLVYNLLIKDGFRVKVYDKVSILCQWGTPEDLEAYLYWSDIFLKHHYG